ncbi:MAG: BrnT family toxin [Anaerolineae bacterium]|nr:BrnT family toxin [Anaerolineae bacterium]
MKFEWDEDKRRTNLHKHGLDFNDDAFVVEDPHDDYDETRYILLGMLAQSIIVISFTVRKDEIIRIISMRKASKREQESIMDPEIWTLKNGINVL